MKLGFAFVYRLAAPGGRNINRTGQSVYNGLAEFLNLTNDYSDISIKSYLDIQGIFLLCHRFTTV
jgi:hypothetical protein